MNGIVLPNGNQIPFPLFPSANSAFNFPLNPVTLQLPIMNPLVFNGTGLFNMNFNPYNTINLPVNLNALPTVGLMGEEELKIEEDYEINVVDVVEEDQNKTVAEQFAEIERKNAEGVHQYRAIMDVLYNNWAQVNATAVQIPSIAYPFGIPDDVVIPNANPNMQPIFAPLTHVPLPPPSPPTRPRARTPGAIAPKSELEAALRGYSKDWRPWYCRGNRDPRRYPPGMEETIEQFDGYEGRHPRADQYPKNFTNAFIGYCEDVYWTERTVPLPKDLIVPPRPRDYYTIRQMTPPPEDFDYIPAAGAPGLQVPIEALIMREDRRRKMKLAEAAAKKKAQAKQPRPSGYELRKKAAEERRRMKNMKQN